MNVLTTVKCHGRTYNIVDKFVHEGYSHVGIYVENKYERGIIFRRWNDVRRGRFKNPLELSSLNTYYGFGSISGKQLVTDVNGNKTEINLGSLYGKMTGRALHSKFISARNKVNYKDTKLSDEWRSFQNWAKWLCGPNSNFRVGYQIDKDILSSDNIYSKETCVYIPPYLNKYLAKKTTISDNVKHQPYMKVCGVILKINPDEYFKYRDLTINLLAKWYCKYEMIPTKIRDVIRSKYPMDKYYNVNLYSDIEKLVKDAVKRDSKIYIKIDKMTNYVKVQRPEHPKLRDIVLPSGSQNASD